MSLGPVEVFLIGFPDNQFTGDVAPALADLVGADTVRIVDLLFLTKGDDGTIASFEVAELEDADGSAYNELVDELHGLLGEEDVEDVAEHLDPGSSVMLVVVEHLWAKPFADAVARSGGTPLGSVHIPREVVDALTA